MSAENQTETPEENEESKPADSSMAAFNPKMQELEDALGVLYIKNNASGRNKFREKWPDIAQYLFEDTLTNYDNYGVADREERRKLEEQADERRFFLKSVIGDIVEKSVDSGILQFEYVGKVVDKFGANISSHIYAENIIERVRPGLLAKEKEEKGSAEQNEKEIRAKEKEILGTTPATDNQADDIKPIETPVAEEKPTEQVTSDKTKQAEDEFSIPETLQPVETTIKEEPASVENPEAPKTPEQPEQEKEENKAPEEEQKQPPVQEAVTQTANEEVTETETETAQPPEKQAENTEKPADKKPEKGSLINAFTSVSKP